MIAPNPTIRVWLERQELREHPLVTQGLLIVAPHIRINQFPLAVGTPYGRMWNQPGFVEEIAQGISDTIARYGVCVVFVDGSAQSWDWKGYGFPNTNEEDGIVASFASQLVAMLDSLSPGWHGKTWLYHDIEAIPGKPEEDSAYRSRIYEVLGRVWIKFIATDRHICFNFASSKEPGHKFIEATIGGQTAIDVPVSHRAYTVDHADTNLRDLIAMKDDLDKRRSDQPYFAHLTVQASNPFNLLRMDGLRRAGLNDVLLFADAVDADLLSAQRPCLELAATPRKLFPSWLYLSWVPDSLRNYLINRLGA